MPQLRNRHGARGPASRTNPTTSADPVSASDGAKEKRIGPLILTVLGGGACLYWLSTAYGFGVRERVQGVCALTVLSVVVLFVTCPPLPQPLAYHNFADQRCLCCGIPNTFDVLSNAPFVLVSAFGLDHITGGSILRAAAVVQPVFADRNTELPLWMTFFVGVGLVAFGSGYYHWRPSNARLVWDRLPMTIAFMSFLAVVLADTVIETTPSATKWTLGFLVAIGLASVVYWDRYDDLRPYVLVQFYSLALIPLLICLFPSRYDGANFEYMVALSIYIGAKIAEALDKQIFSLTGGLFSGHTLKHLLSGVTTFWASVVLMRRKQRA